MLSLLNQLFNKPNKPSYLYQVTIRYDQGPDLVYDTKTTEELDEYRQHLPEYIHYGRYGVHYTDSDGFTRRRKVIGWKVEEMEK